MAESSSVAVRNLEDSHFDAWLTLWKGYQTFYKTEFPDDISRETWRRFHDADEPMHVLGGFVDEQLLGIVHFLFHRSTWTVGNYCYLQDLFTAADVRGQGVGQALIQAVYGRAREAGASRVYWLTQRDNKVARGLYDKLADDTDLMQYRKLF